MMPRSGMQRAQRAVTSMARERAAARAMGRGRALDGSPPALLLNRGWGWGRDGTVIEMTFPLKNNGMRKR